ncbi:acyl-CoA--6-aminopenicillanic acid acyltransferase [Cryomorpha ignava]|uniref:Acyl-CoA--6-aminopenicillanic acid acyltransferase n=1 Tax=Cryomorpha ignava TaxID=101383 RepID=A0A7K3WL16_9FLAO|nr:C45 family peptidase [Cryomorpha ignava]NEN22329.1 acyl-CoA--6-aminopenicillanic acid acyltransferase [Cryomorpha ignava]
MNLDIHSISEKKPGKKWQKLFQKHWPAYKGWYLSKMNANSPDLKTCRAQLKKYMPEFYPTYLHLCKLAGPDPVAHRFLTGYQPPAYISGCAQIVSEKEAQLVRNYDFDPNLSEGTLLQSAWNGRSVIAMGDCLIGVVDGMNDSGLVVSLTFGGRKVVGVGFGIPFILRYVMEYCTTLTEAVAALERIPSHMSYNIMLMNKQGEHNLVQLAPDRAPVVTDLSASTNHQGVVDWPEHAAFTKTIERELYLHEMLAQDERTSEQIADAFLKAPLFNRKYSQGFGTIYTAVYQPKEGAMELRWPGIRLRQTFDNFQEGVTAVSYSERIEVSTTNAIPADQLQADYTGAVENYWTEYGRSWANHEHNAESLHSISARIQELLAQMDSVSKAGETYPWQEVADAWIKVGSEKV